MVGAARYPSSFRRSVRRAGEDEEPYVAAHGARCSAVSERACFSASRLKDFIASGCKTLILLIILNEIAPRPRKPLS